MKKVIVSLVAVTLCLAFLGNGLVRLSEKRAEVDAAWQTIAAVYQQRAAVVPAYIERVSSLVAGAELRRVQEVATALAKVGQVPADPRHSLAAWQQYQDAQDKLTGTLARCAVIQYTNHRLQADGPATGLARQLEGLEDRINVARKSYNVAGHEFNLSKRNLAAALANALVSHLPDCPQLGTGNSSRVAIAASL
jgi:LemA protein